MANVNSRHKLSEIVQEKEGEMESILENTSSMCASIDSIYLGKHKSIKDGNVMIGKFSIDQTLKESIERIKTISEVISGSCTKMTMISTQILSEEALQSISEEMNSQLTSLHSALLLTLDCSLSWPLFQLLLATVREVFTGVQDLTKLTKSRSNPQLLRNATGVVWKSCEEIKKLPLTNKAAYRRDTMEKIATIKDTIREFEGYIDEYHTKVANGTLKPKSHANDDEDDEDNDDDFNFEDMEEDYSNTEAAMVIQSLKLFQLARDVLITGLGAYTHIGDYSDTNSLQNSTDEIHRMRTWLAKINHDAKNIQDAVTNCGAELYPQVEPEETGYKYELLRIALQQYIKSLKHEDVIHIFSATNANLLEKINEFSTNELTSTNIDFHSL